MAKEKPKSKVKQKGKNQIFAVAGIVMAGVFLPSSVLLFIGMLPTFVAVFVDRSKKKTRGVTIGALNLAGCSPFLLELWVQGHSMEKAMTIVTDPKAIIVMYAAAAVGYMINWSLSGIVAAMLFQRGIARQEAIKKRQAELAERWGREVTGQIPLDHYGFAIEPIAKSQKELL